MHLSATDSEMLSGAQGPVTRFAMELLVASGCAVGADSFIEPLSLWGGLDPTTGLVMDQSHPQLGVSLTGCIVIMPHGRGSSSSSSVLADSLRSGTGGRQPWFRKNRTRFSSSESSLAPMGHWACLAFEAPRPIQRIPLYGR